MKKKAKRYAEGGESVYERAKRFLQQGRPEQGDAPALRPGEETSALDERIAEARKKVATVSDPLAGVIKQAETRDKARQEKARREPSEAARRVIAEGRRIDAVNKRIADEVALGLRNLNNLGIDIPKDLETEYMGTQDRPDYPKFAKGGAVKSASKRADGIATKGKTRGKYL